MLDITRQQRWGILGDGQLARMLALEAFNLGLRPVILTGDSSSPAGQVSPLIVRGHIDSRDDLHAILSQVDGAIIESEFINCDALEATGLSDKVTPSIAVIRVLQNKLLQKKLLQELNIPSSPLYEKTMADDTSWIRELTNNGTKPLVLKLAVLGYDGKGVLLLNGAGRSDLEKAEDFLTTARKRKLPVYAEERVNFTKELAMVAVRRTDGEFKSWPLVITEQQGGICDKVAGPACSLGVDKKAEDYAHNVCKKLAAHLGIIGVFAVEFFLTNQGDLLVNEIAPRVHNSGHYTQNAGCTSQFENHWRAVLNMSLGPTGTAPFFAMQNLLSPPEFTSKECATPPRAGELTHIHWYGKRGVSPGRKLGHINTLCHDISQKGDAISALQSTYGRWQAEQREKFQNISVPGGLNNEHQN